MTTTINLLPWREERRQELKKQFFVMLAGAAIIGAGTVYLYNMVIESKIDNQKQRNQHIVQETKKLEEKIKEIAELKKKRESLVERMNVIQELQGNRPVIVHVFDQMAKTIPDGVYYTSLKARNNIFQVQGMAESNSRVSGLMRNMSDSPMFTSPNLSRVDVVERNGEDWSRFSLNVQRGAPKAAEGEDKS